MRIIKCKISNLPVNIEKIDFISVTSPIFQIQDTFDCKHEKYLTISI